MRRAIPLLSFLLVCQTPRAQIRGPAGTPAATPVVALEAGPSFQAQLTAGSRKQASRLLLESRFREARSRMDSLWEDSLHVAPGELHRFRKALHTASKVLAEAESRLADLRRAESEGDAREWESLRSRMERTLYGISRYLSDTEAYWLPARMPGASPVPEDGEGEL